jgi:small subunit ribosomal protein S2
VELGANQEKYQLNLESMLKAGVHFGHKKSRWNPKMKQYLFGVRNGIHIIDLERTKEMFQKALDYMGEISQKNGMILIVGTKKQAKDLVRAVAERVEMPFVNERWLGGTFTNYNTIAKRVKYLVDGKEGLEKGRFNDLTKLERLRLHKELEKMEERMGGLVPMKRLPEAILVLDIKKDEIAIKEAKKAGVKVIALVDSNCDPTTVDYPIPANDDALSSLKYMMGVILKRILETKNTAVQPADKK